MLEAAIKPNWPEDFKRIIDITYRFSSGWRRVHNPITGHDVADDLTTTEFAVCDAGGPGLDHPGDRPEHLNISANTVKTPYFRGHEKAEGEEPEEPETVYAAIETCPRA